MASAAEASPRVAQLERMLQELRARPQSPARLGEEARLLHFLAEASEDGGQRDRYREQGRALAKRALAEDPEQPAALLWWTAHRGSQATALNPFQAVKIAREIEQTLLRLRAVAPGYDSSAADRVLGIVYQVAPAVVSIGSKEKARTHLNAALARHPEHPGNLLSAAKFLLENGDCPKAKRLSRQVLASSALADPLEGPLWRAEAQRLLSSASRECR